jgi:hypothetical protein
MEFAMSNRLEILGYSQADVAAMIAARKAWTAYLRGPGTQQQAVDALATSWRNQMDDNMLGALDDVRVPVLCIYGGTRVFYTDGILAGTCTHAQPAEAHRPGDGSAQDMARLAGEVEAGDAV